MGSNKPVSPGLLVARSLTNHLFERNAHARGIMTASAKAAGFLNISLIYEPIAAAAADMIKMRSRGYIGVRVLNLSTSSAND